MALDLFHKQIESKIIYLEEIWRIGSLKKNKHGGDSYYRLCVRKKTEAQHIKEIIVAQQEGLIKSRKHTFIVD